MRQVLRNTLTLALALGVAAACGDGRGGGNASSSGSTEADVISSALEAGLQDDSMDESDEAPDAFLTSTGESDASNDPAVAAEDSAPPSETAVTGSDATLVEQAEAQTVEPATVFFLTVGWGHFPFQRDATPIDVNGTLALDVGALTVSRRVALEQLHQGDSIRRDSAMPLRKLNIDTSVGCCMDGLAVKVVLHESINQTATNTPREATLTLALEGQSPLSIALNPSVETIDAGVTLSNGLRIHVMGFQKQPLAACKQGYMLGRWAWRATSDDGRELGRFAGRYMAEDASRAGFVRGVFGQKDDGSRAFFGKIVGVDGRFKGLMSGTYSDGTFHGSFHVNRNAVSGVVDGRTAMAASTANGSLGFFRGRWSQDCGETP